MTPTKSMRYILRGAIANSMLIRHIDEQAGYARYREVSNMLNGWWQRVMDKKPEDYKTAFIGEMPEAAKLVNGVGGSMKQTDDGVWIIGQTDNPVRPEEKRILTPYDN